MKNEWDEYAADWDTNPAVKEYARKAFSELLNTISIEGLSVLDFGCGTRALTELISPKATSVVAMDPSLEMIKQLEKKKLENVLCIHDYLSEEFLEKFPEYTHTFDLILASSVCGFLPDYEGTLGLLKTLLKKGGVFVQWDWLSEDDSAAIGLSEKRVTQAFGSNGMRVWESEENS